MKYKVTSDKSGSASYNNGHGHYLLCFITKFTFYYFTYPKVYAILYSSCERCHSYFLSEDHILHFCLVVWLFAVLSQVHLLLTFNKRKRTLLMNKQDTTTIILKSKKLLLPFINSQKMKKSAKCVNDVKKLCLSNVHGNI